MKKFLCMVLVFITILSLGTTVLADEQQVRVVLDGEILEFDQQPVIQNGRTLVPLRGIFEPMGAEVGWDDATQTVTAVKDDITIKLTVGESILYKNGEAITLDVPAQLIGSRTMVPARAVSEAFDARVGWIEETWVVTILTDEALINKIEEIENYKGFVIEMNWTQEIEGFDADMTVQIGAHKSEELAFSRTTVYLPTLETGAEEVSASNGIITFKKDAEGNKTSVNEGTTFNAEKLLSLLLRECGLAGFEEEQEGMKRYITAAGTRIVISPNLMLLRDSAETFGMRELEVTGEVDIWIYEDDGEALRAWYDSMIIE